MSDLNRINANQPINPGQPLGKNQNGNRTGSGSFENVLSEAQSRNVHFSNHAAKRLQTRNIQMTEESLNRLDSAINEAQTKGGKDSLVLMDDLAFIVNVKERMVVTAMDVAERGGGTFTQIDSVVISQPKSE